MSDKNSAIDYSTLDVGAAYRDARARILEITTGLTDAEWEMKVPHCPAWTVRETLAHLAGVCDDGINGRMDGVATDAWTDAQVSKRAGQPGPTIAEEWATWGPFVDARGTEAGLRLAQLLFDTVTHEHDLRHALGKPGARTSDALMVALSFLSGRLETRAVEEGYELALTITDAPNGPADALSETRAPGLSPITLATTMFDAVRSFGSRRTMREICALNWSLDPTDLMSKVAPFALPLSELSE